MKKTLGIFIVFLWGTIFFYYFNMFMPKGILYIALSFPVVLLTTLFILRKFGFKV